MQQLPKINNSIINICATVSFMDIKSASKAHNAVHKFDDRILTTEYYEPSSIPQIGRRLIDGGGPNNKMILKNNSTNICGNNLQISGGGGGGGSSLILNTASGNSGNGIGVGGGGGGNGTQVLQSVVGQNQHFTNNINVTRFTTSHG